MTTYIPPATRLETARLRQQEARRRIEAIATNSIVAWITDALRRVVGRVVHSVVGWFARLFR